MSCAVLPWPSILSLQGGRWDLPFRLKTFAIVPSVADRPELLETVDTAPGTSTYPGLVANMHPPTISDLAQTPDVVSRLCDHTLATVVTVALPVVGAAVIEKRFTLSRSYGGPDAAFSLEPSEFARLAHDVRFAWDAVGTVKYECKPSETASLIFRRSLYVVRDIAQGEQGAGMNVRSIRPRHGLAPRRLGHVIGGRSRTPFIKGAALHWDLMV
jgi:sialic acid synthase SpsE